MERLTPEQRTDVQQFLLSRGLTFPPLLHEMTDHICCDLENQMADGATYEEAWTAIAALPDNHFSNLQQNTMHSITRNFNLSGALSYAALGLFLTSLLFKILHLQFGGVLLLTAFLFIAVALVINATAALKLHRQKTGTIRVVLVIASVVVLILGYALKVAHLPGADPVIAIAVTAAVIFIIVNSMAIGRSKTDGPSLLSVLHEKYTPGIDRFLLMLLLPLAVFKLITILVPGIPFSGDILLVVAIFAAGLQFIGLTWRALEQRHDKSPAIIILSAVAAICFVLPFLGPLLGYQIRVGIIVLFTISAALITNGDRSNHRMLVLFLCIIYPLIFIVWGVEHITGLPENLLKLFFNVPLFIVLIISVLISKKESYTRGYAMVSLAAYALEFQMN